VLVPARCRAPVCQRNGLAFRGSHNRPCPTQRGQQERAALPGIYQEERPSVTSG
jgi:hypothetical protein